MKIDYSVDWDFDRSIGAKVVRGDIYGVDSGVDTGVVIGDG